jgi:hypothetical protein
MQMPNRNAKLLLAVFAGVLVSANFTPALNNSAHAEDNNCLAAPNGQTPHGSHWHYRIERGTKRHCWYLREESDAQPQSAEATSSPPPAPAKPTPPKADTAMQGSVANARAELPWPQPSATPDTPAPAAQVPPAAAPTTPSSDSSDNGQPVTSSAPATDPNALPATVASRWPNQLNTDASDDSAPDTANSNTAAQPDIAAAPPPPAATPVPLATSEPPPSSSKQPGSMSTLLTIMVAALALAGVVGGAILRFGGRKRDDDEGEIHIDRRPVWDVEHRDHPRPYPAAPSTAPAGPRPNIGLPRELRKVEPDDAIKEMLARLARSAQT